MSTHLCTFSRATPGTDPAPTPATGPQPLSAITICVKYEPSSSVGYIMLCSQILSQNSIDFMKNIGEKYFQTCFWPKPCTEPVLVLCCVCVKTCAVGQKCCVPCVASLLLLGGNVSVDQGRTQQSSTESSKLHQLTVTVPSHELKSFPPCPSRPFHNAPSLSLTSLPSYHQKNRYSHKKCISWCDCEQQEQGETILCILVLGKKLVIMYQSQINQSTQPLGSDITWKRQLTDGYLLASTKPD